MKNKIKQSILLSRLMIFPGLILSLGLIINGYNFTLTPISLKTIEIIFIGLSIFSLIFIFLSKKTSSAFFLLILGIINYFILKNCSFSSINLWSVFLFSNLGLFYFLDLDKHLKFLIISLEVLLITFIGFFGERILSPENMLIITEAINKIFEYKILKITTLLPEISIVLFALCLTIFLIRSSSSGDLSDYSHIVFIILLMLTFIFQESEKSLIIFSICITALFSSLFFSYLYDKVKKDSLTGLYNIRTFENHLQNMNEPFCLGLINIDELKLYNKLYGESTGDEILKMISINLALSGFDSYRLEDDNFGIIIKGYNAKSASKLVDKIKRDILSKSFIIRGEVRPNSDRIGRKLRGTLAQNKLKRIKISVSYGISEYHEDDFSFKDILLRAGQNLKLAQAKSELERK